MTKDQIRNRLNAIGLVADRAKVYLERKDLDGKRMYVEEIEAIERLAAELSGHADVDEE